MALRRFLLPLLLLAAALLITQTEGIGSPASDCCLKYSRKAIPRNVVRSYRLQGPEMGCILTAVVFTTKKNRKICASPTNASAKKLMESLDNKDKNDKKEALPLRSKSRPKKQRRQQV